MNSIQKFSYQIFCINFCDSTGRRKLFLALHSSVLVATLVFVHYNQVYTFTVPFCTDNTSSLTVRIWFYCYIIVYVVILAEGFWKDATFQAKYAATIREVCERHRKKRNFYGYVMMFLLLGDSLYLVISYLTKSSYQYLHNSCLIPKMCIRIRLWEYLFFAKGILNELEKIVQRVEEIPGDATEQDFLSIQENYLDLWMTSRDIGDNFVAGLCCIFLYIFFDMIVLCYWFFTIDFGLDEYYSCEWVVDW